MTGQLWSWTLAGLGVGALWLIGSRRQVGWALGVGQQVLWVAYAVATRQWGFIASALAFGATYLRGWRRWRRERRVREALTEELGGYAPPDEHGHHAHDGERELHARGERPHYHDDGVRFFVHPQEP